MHTRYTAWCTQTFLSRKWIRRKETSGRLTWRQRKKKQITKGNDNNTRTEWLLTENNDAPGKEGDHTKYGYIMWMELCVAMSKSQMHCDSKVPQHDINMFGFRKEMESWTATTHPMPQYQIFNYIAWRGEKILANVPIWLGICPYTI